MDWAFEGGGAGADQKLKGVPQNFGISNIFIKNWENAKICFQLLQNIK